MIKNKFSTETLVIGVTILLAKTSGKMSFFQLLAISKTLWKVRLHSWMLIKMHLLTPKLIIFLTIFPYFKISRSSTRCHLQEELLHLYKVHKDDFFFNFCLLWLLPNFSFQTWNLHVKHKFIFISGHLSPTSFYHNSKNGQTVSDLLNDNARSEPTIYFLTCVQQWIFLVNKQNYSIPI